MTSAACVEDVEFMYAIAGYGVYVKADAIASDKCANAVKKKIVLSCVPKCKYLLLINDTYDIKIIIARLSLNSSGRRSYVSIFDHYVCKFL